ncbi:hypothetical protein JD969_13190 [Planctomycetota bacterium]|nr:hypothetical protein JD969_13190 [Planctomycetota bacterium]
MKTPIIVMSAFMLFVIITAAFMFIGNQSRESFHQGPYTCLASDDSQITFDLIGWDGTNIENANCIILATGPNHSFDLTLNQHVKINANAIPITQFYSNKINIIRPDGYIVPVNLSRKNLQIWINNYQANAPLPAWYFQVLNIDSEILMLPKALEVSSQTIPIF